MKLFYSCLSATSVLVGFILVFTALPVYSSQTDLKIAMVLWRGETRAEEGFKAELEQLGYTAEYHTLNANQDLSALAELTRNENKFAAFDYIYAFGTTVTLFISRIVGDTPPIIFNVVTDPVKSKIIDKMDAPGKNISGASNYIPLKIEIENALKVIPFKRLGIFFNPREKNSDIIKKQLIGISEKMGFEVITLRCPPVGPLFEQHLTNVANNTIGVDAIYLPSDSFLASQAKRIGRQLKKGKIASIGSIRRFVEMGALLGTVPDYYALGTQAAQVIDRHQKGDPLSTIPVQTPKHPALVINTTTAAHLGIDIDPEVLKQAVLVK
jgi:putative ABC transport system substrate-binding protein